MEQLPKPERDTVALNIARIIRNIVYSIIAESPYKPDTEWQVWHEAHRLEEENLLPEGIDAEDVFQDYLRVYCGE